MTKEITETYVPLDKATWLIRQGLGQDLTRLTWYTQCLQNPQGMVKQIAFRDYVGELLSNLTSFIFNDPVAYARLAQYLLSQHRPASMRSVHPRTFESLIQKAETSKVPIEVLVEVYHRGYTDPKKPRHLTLEQHAFNRVNSYCNKGKAYQMDEDLNPSTREVGTDSLYNTYRKDTPGQTLKTIKRIVKEQK